jgi:hypothetical protein
MRCDAMAVVCVCVCVCARAQGRERPDYGRCVSIVTEAALSEMIAPGILAVVRSNIIRNMRCFTSVQRRVLIARVFVCSCRQQSLGSFVSFLFVKNGLIADVCFTICSIWSPVSALNFWVDLPPK